MESSKVAREATSRSFRDRAYLINGVRSGYCKDCLLVVSPDRLVDEAYKVELYIHSDIF